MAKFTLTHEINCSADTFWKLHFDKVFNEKLFVGELDFIEWKVIEQTDTGSEIIRKVHAVMKNTLPGPIAKLFGGNPSYQEDGRFNKAKGVFTFKTTPESMADKVRNEGELRIEPLGDKKVRRIVDFVFEAKVFAVGGLIESTAEKSLRDGYDKSAAFLSRWVAEGKAA
jgi:hypothetical protein